MCRVSLRCVFVLIENAGIGYHWYAKSSVPGAPLTQPISTAAGLAETLIPQEQAKCDPHTGIMKTTNRARGHRNH